MTAPLDLARLALKPCWRCGETLGLRFGGMNVGNKGGYRHVQCDQRNGGCGAMGPSANFSPERKETEAMAQTVAAQCWNERPIEATLTAQRDAFAELLMEFTGYDGRRPDYLDLTKRARQALFDANALKPRSTDPALSRQEPTR